MTKLTTPYPNCLPLVVAVAIALAGCSSTKDLPEGAYDVAQVSVECSNKDVDASTLREYVQQKPNTKILGIFHKIKAKPVVYDSLLTSQSVADITNAVKNLGYLQARVRAENTIDGKKIRTKYIVDTDEPYFITSFATDIRDEAVRQLVAANSDILAPLQTGRPFSVYSLNDTRNQLTSLLNDNGYYRFNKDYVDFTVDTMAHNTGVGVLLTLYPYHTSADSIYDPHTQYTIRNVNFLSSDSTRLHIRPRVLRYNTTIHPGDLYSNSAVRRTYNNFSHLQAVRYTNISFTEVPDSNLLDCNIQISTTKPSSISIQPEGTNTAGDFGAALILGYTNNNLFRGSEVFSVEARGAFEAIRGLEGYSDQNYQEYSLEAKLTFPRFVVPSHAAQRRVQQTMTNHSTELALSYNLQNRPEFHRRLFSASWRYRWTNSKKGIAYRLDLLEVNYIYMPWISETFRQDYLDNNESRNAILRYNYEDLFIMKLGFGLTKTHKDFSYRFNVETAGNLLHGIASLTHFPKNKDGQYTFFHIAYAQYAKADFEYTRNFSFGPNHQIAIHGAVGVAYPYGNSTILPFEKRYFSGGANSVRGWSVRSLGPGRFHGKDGRIDFINQTGDIKLDLNAEYRAKLFWKFYGAFFIDAGNIWTIRHYTDQEGGQFRWDQFYKELAAAYGLGIRLHLGYFVLRFDFGMKAVNPDYTDSHSHFPIYHPRLSRDLAVHFAVGLPF